MDVLIGVEYGRQKGSSAICVAENPRRVNSRGVTETEFEIRFLERLAVGTSMPDLAERLAAVEAGALREADQNRSVVYLNTTGGAALLDCLGSYTKSKIRPVYFNHGDRIHVEHPEVQIGKNYLITRLQMLLQSRRLHLPRTAQATRLAEELLQYEISFAGGDGELYGSFAMGPQDDLVMALGLATLADVPSRGRQSFGALRPPGY